IEALLTEQQRPYRVYTRETDVLEEGEGAHLYKIQGSVGTPESLVFTAADHEENQAYETVIFSKIAELAKHHPLIFLGYGKEDREYQHMMKGVLAAASEQIQSLVVVNFETEATKMLQKQYVDDQTGQEIRVIESTDEAKVFETLTHDYFKDVTAGVTNQKNEAEEKTTALIQTIETFLEEQPLQKESENAPSITVVNEKTGNFLSSDFPYEKQTTKSTQKSVGQTFPFNRVNRVSSQQPTLNKGLKYGIISLFSIALLLIIVTRFFFSPAIVEGESMMPTLTSSDYVLLNKFHLQVSRYEVIAFDSPDVANKKYIKRVIGLSGDTIEMKNDTLFINGEAQEEAYLASEREHLKPGEQLTKDFTLKELTGVATVPKGKLFVMGDNRLYSRDSREFGFIDESAVQGKAERVIWPFSRMKTFE
ncbi:signal peptidase I, partial [Isobaculum melis]